MAQNTVINALQNYVGNLCGFVRKTPISDPIEKALAKSEIKIIGNGEDALSFILKEGKYKDAFSPELVILDLNLPGKMQGFDLLKYLKLSDLDLNRIPVRIFSACDDPKLIKQAYDLHANAYVCKTPDYQEFLHIIKTMEQFWMNIIQLPFKGCYI